MTGRSRNPGPTSARPGHGRDAAGQNPPEARGRLPRPVNAPVMRAAPGLLPARFRNGPSSPGGTPRSLQQPLTRIFPEDADGRVVKRGNGRESGTGAGSRVPSDLTETFIGGLAAEAAGSPEREVYHSLSCRRGCRIGLTVAVAARGSPSFTFVVLLDRSDEDGVLARDGAGARKALARRGYATTRLENGWVALERSVPRGRVPGEWRHLRRFLAVASDAAERGPGNGTRGRGQR